MFCQPLVSFVFVSDLTIDDEDEEEIIDRRRRERQALMSKLNAENSTQLPTKVFEVVSASTDPVDDERESDDEQDERVDDDDNDAAQSEDGFDVVSNDSPGSERTANDVIAGNDRERFMISIKFSENICQA